MDLSLTDDQELFRKTARAFLERESPLRTVRDWADLPDGYPPAWWRRAAELGFTSLLVSEADGGGSVSGQGLSDLVILAEEMGRVVSPGSLVPTNVVAAAVSAAGTAEQRVGLLPEILTGDTTASWCDASRGLRVDRDADDFVLTGMVAPVEGAAAASVLLVTAEGADGLTQFLVPAASTGVTISPLAGIDLVRRFARVEFDGVRVSASAVLGETGAAALAVEWQGLTALVLQCAETVGAMDRVFEFTVEYLGDRYSFGRPLVSYQVIKHALADMNLWLEASQGITTLAAHALEDRSAEHVETVHAAAAYVGDHGTELVQRAVQLHGGIGITWDHDLHLYLRRVTLNRSLQGTPAQHRERLAAISLQDLDDRGSA